MKVNLPIIGFTIMLLALVAAGVLSLWGPKRLSHTNG